MKQIAICALAWVMSGSALAVEWTLITTSGDLNKLTYWYVDPASIQMEANLLKARLRTAWSKVQYGPNNTGYQSTTYLNFIDCERRAIAFTGNTYFSDIESTGEPIYQEEELPAQALRFAPVKPGTPGEIRLNYLCKSHESSSNRVI